MSLATPFNRVRTRRHTGLARSAAGYVTTPNADPFDLVRRGSKIPGVPAPSPPTPVAPTPASASTSTGSPPGAPGSSPAPPPGQYDLSSDPVLQQVMAAAAHGDASARASALAAREQALLSYGDPALARSVLGATDPMVAAAGQNQESALARLKRGYGEGLWNFDNTLDPSLAFSGARIKGEGQLGQDYQDNLAEAAAAIQSQLGGITEALNAALGGDADRVSQAYADAYNRMLQAALANPPAADPSTLAALAALGG